MSLSRAGLLALAILAALVAPPFDGAAAAEPDKSRGGAGDRKDFPGIEKLMPREDFQRAGLDKLTPEELRALDAWLLRYTAGEAYVVQTTSEEVRAAAPAFRIEARIVGPFTGWSGQTLFQLDNGQVWRQRIKGRYMYKDDDTRVVITRNLLGYYNMTLVATGRGVGVEPVRKPGKGSGSD